MLRLSAVAAALCLAGCAGAVDFDPIALPPRDVGPRPVLSVQYFGAPPKTPFVVVGHLDEHGYPPSSLREVLQRLRVRAARVGCDGIVTEGSWGPQASMTIDPPPEAPAPAPKSEEAHYRADCIVFQRR